MIERLSSQEEKRAENMKREGHNRSPYYPVHIFHASITPETAIKPENKKDKQAQHGIDRCKLIENAKKDRKACAIISAKGYFSADGK